MEIFGQGFPPKDLIPWNGATSLRKLDDREFVDGRVAWHPEVLEKSQAARLNLSAPPSSDTRTL
jgi:hypothetical protein